MEGLRTNSYRHYLLHRKRLPKGIECDENVVTRRDGKGIEKEADEFAAWVLMPLDDFRARIAAGDKRSIDDLDKAANHYGVSLTAATLRWLEYTDRRALFVVSRDGGALWARSSDAAYKTGRFIRTVSETYMLPEQSLAVQANWDADGRAAGVLQSGVWFPEETEETSIYAKHVDITLTLLHLPKQTGWITFEEPGTPDTYDHLSSRG